MGVRAATAVPDDDGRNVITALQAKQLGMSRVIAIVQDPDYLPLLEKEGVVAIRSEGMPLAETISCNLRPANKGHLRHMRAPHRIQAAVSPLGPVWQRSLLHR